MFTLYILRISVTVLISTYMSGEIALLLRLHQGANDWFQLVHSKEGILVTDITSSFSLLAAAKLHKTSIL